MVRCIDGRWIDVSLTYGCGQSRQWIVRGLHKHAICTRLLQDSHDGHVSRFFLLRQHALCQRVSPQLLRWQRLHPHQRARQHQARQWHCPRYSAVVRKKLMGYVGFANLPNQVHRKSVRKGFQFTAMVVGEPQLDTSTTFHPWLMSNFLHRGIRSGQVDSCQHSF